MKSIAERIAEGMAIRNMKQVDIIEKAGVNKGALSSYLSGKYEPKQTNIYLIAKALDVNEAWLMGYDVPMERNSMPQSSEDPLVKAILNSGNATSELDNEILKLKIINKVELEAMDYSLLAEFKKLNISGKKEAINRVTELTYIPHYTGSNVAPIKQKKERYIPTEEDIQSLVARNGKKFTREEAIEFISDMLSDDDEE